jgi:hypothetical protein
LWIGAGKLAVSNGAQVKVREILEGLGSEIATPAEAREILSLNVEDTELFVREVRSCLLSARWYGFSVNPTHSSALLRPLHTTLIALR